MVWPLCSVVEVAGVGFPGLHSWAAAGPALWAWRRRNFVFRLSEPKIEGCIQTPARPAGARPCRWSALATAACTRCGRSVRLRISRLVVLLRHAHRPRHCPTQNVLQLLLDCGALPEEELIENVIGCIEAHSQEAQAHKLKVPPTEEARQVFMRKIVLEEISKSLRRRGAQHCAQATRQDFSTRRPRCRVGGGMRRILIRLASCIRPGAPGSQSPSLYFSQLPALTLCIPRSYPPPPLYRPCIRPGTRAAGHEGGYEAPQGRTLFWARQPARCALASLNIYLAWSPLTIHTPIYTASSHRPFTPSPSICRGRDPHGDFTHAHRPLTLLFTSLLHTAHSHPLPFALQRTSCRSRATSARRRRSTSTCSSRPYRAPRNSRWMCGPQPRRRENPVAPSYSPIIGPDAPFTLWVSAGGAFTLRVWAGAFTTGSTRSLRGRVMVWQQRMLGRRRVRDVGRG